MSVALKRQFSVQWRDTWAAFACMMAAFLIGSLMFCLIVAVDGDVSGYLPLGTMFACMVAVMYTAVFNLVQIRIAFNTQIAMGSTRKEFYVSFYLVQAVFDLVYLCLLAVLCALEEACYGRLYPQMEAGMKFLPLLLRWGIWAAVMLPAAGGFCGLLTLRFGYKAFWIFWGLWMFGCLGVPQIHSAAEDAPQSLLGRFGISMQELFGRVPETVWAGIAAVLFLLILAGSWMLVRRQQVTS